MTKLYSPLLSQGGKEYFLYSIMPKVHHMVLLKFKADTSVEKVAEIKSALEGLKQVIPGKIHFLFESEQIWYNLMSLVLT